MPLRTGRSAIPGALLRYRRAVRAVLLLVTAVLAVGCTTAVPGTPSAAGPTPLPPRPREVRLDGVDPCSVLTLEQRAALGYQSAASSSRPYVELFSGDVPTCTMSSSSADPTILGIGLVTTVGIERWQEGNVEAVVRPDHVAGFPAIFAVPNQSKTYCAVEVDVAAGQLLDIQFLDAGHQPPLRPEELCSRAKQSAEAAIKTLLTR